MENVISNAVLSINKGGGYHELTQNIFLNTSKAIVISVNYCNIVPRLLMSKNKEVMSLKNKKARDFYFNTLGYRTVYYKRNQDQNDVYD